MGLFNRRQASDETAATTSSSPTVIPEDSKQQITRATRTRKTWALISSSLLFVSVIFLILLQIGGIYNRSLIRNWYFIRLDLSNIVPSSVSKSPLINKIAQTIGLHDFYQVGLWGFCEGYESEGVTFCSKPRSLYWFNPVEILRNELLAGASITLPPKVNDILALIKLASHWMFGLFLTGTCLSFVLVFLMPLSICSRWLAVPIAFLAFLNALFITAASVIATAMFIIFRKTISGVATLNIGAEIGTTMFAFMWIASAFAISAWLVQMGLCCCCASRRDVEKGKIKGNEKAYHSHGAEGV